MIRIRHILCAVAAFDLVMGLAFVVADSADAQTGAVACCIPAQANNTLPAPGMCFAPAKFARCEESNAPGHIPCAGTFTGTAIPAMLSSTNSGDAEGCVLVDGTIDVLQETRRCTGRGTKSCECTTVMTANVAVSTKVASGLTCR